MGKYRNYSLETKVRIAPLAIVFALTARRLMEGLEGGLGN